MEIFYSEGGEVLAQGVQRGCERPIPGGTQDQVGWGCRQPDVVVGNPTHGRELEHYDPCGPFQPKPLYDSHAHFIMTSNVNFYLHKKSLSQVSKSPSKNPMICLRKQKENN